MNELTVLSIFTGMESVHAYSAFLPSVFTIGTFVNDQAGVALIRRGELYATLLATGMGLIVSKIAKNFLPFWFSLGAAAVMLVVYEQSLSTWTSNASSS